MLGKGQKLGVYPVKDIFVAGEGFGCYLSEDPFFKSKVLLNVYRIDYLSNDQQSCLKKRLDQLFLLDHPVIVPAIDSGYENGSFYYTTQYYEQDSFQQYVMDGTSGAEVKKLFQQLAQALEYAESCDHFHGIIETEDIVFDESGDVKLLNFGVFQCIDFDRAKNVPLNEKISESLSSLGQHIQTLLSERHKNGDESLNVIIDRCLCREGEQYQSFKSLIDELDQLVIGNDDVDMPDIVRPGSAMQTVGGASISEEQRTQILPHVRELISEKNRVQADFDAFKLEHEKIQIDLDNALQETESLAQRLHLVTRFDREQDRKKKIASVFTGVFIGLLLTTSSFYFFNSVETSEIIETNIVYESKSESVLKKAVIAPVKLSESQKKAQPILQVPVAIEMVEAPEKDVSVDQGKPMPWTVVDSGKVFFNVSTAQAADDEVIIFDKAETKAIEQTMTDWSEFWARQEFDQYISYYSDSFQPADGMDVGVWKRTRQSRLKRPDWIEVGVSEVKVDPMSRQRARVLFQQHYRSDRYEDDSFKEVILIKEGGNWRILHEKSLEI